MLAPRFHKLNKMFSEWPKKIPLAAMPDLISAAMDVAMLELATDPDTKRQSLWNTCFSKLYQSIPSYQFQDFEIVDYDLKILEDVGFIRGPGLERADLETGRYICMLGAAQFFGRFHKKSLHTMLAERWEMPVLNLAAGGAGPGLYIDPQYRPYLLGAKLTLVQVLSGRSIGCDEYPGGIKTRRKSGEPILREKLLREFIENDREEYMRLVRKWSDLYCDYYKRLAALLPGRKILVWMSERVPEGWSLEKGIESGYLGRFPQMVTRTMVERIAGCFDAYVECVDRMPAPMTFRSRATGMPCPFMTNQGASQWSTDYYPYASAHEHCFKLLEPVVASLIT